MQHFLKMFCLCLVLCSSCFARELLLRDNLKKAQTGDFIVAEQNRTDTVLLVRYKKDDVLAFEEITAPCGLTRAWKAWVQQGAPGHTGWVLYTVNLNTGQMSDFYSYTKQTWIQVPEKENFLSTLLNLRLSLIPQNERKKIGPPTFDGRDRRSLWQPKLIFEGQQIDGVTFEAWKTRWPQDGSDLSGKLIEVYVPSEDQMYPAYFPYWLQVSGIIGKAKVRIIDSGRGLVSPQRSSQG